MNFPKFPSLVYVCVSADANSSQKLQKMANFDG